MPAERELEQLRRQYTNKKVVVDGTRPELRRFAGLTGVVKTVNKNGRALVEFLNTKNVGWYDIDLQFLKLAEEAEAQKSEAGKAEASEATR